MAEPPGIGSSTKQAWLLKDKICLYQLHPHHRNEQKKIALSGTLRYLKSRCLENTQTQPLPLTLLCTLGKRSICAHKGVPRQCACWGSSFLLLASPTCVFSMSALLPPIALFIKAETVAHSLADDSSSLPHTLLQPSELKGLTTH